MGTIEEHVEEQPAGKALPEPLVYTVEQAAAALGIGIVRTRRLVRTGDLASFRAGRHIKIPKRAIEAYIEQEAFGADSGRR